MMETPSTLLLLLSTVVNICLIASTSANVDPEMEGRLKDS